MIKIIRDASLDGDPRHVGVLEVRYPGDVTGRDDKDIIISMITGADSRTCLRDDSTHAIYLVFGHPEMSDGCIEEIAGEIKEAALALAPDAETEFAVF